MKCGNVEKEEEKWETGEMVAEFTLYCPFSQ